MIGAKAVADLVRKKLSLVLQTIVAWAWKWWSGVWVGGLGSESVMAFEYIEKGRVRGKGRCQNKKTHLALDASFF